MKKDKILMDYLEGKGHISIEIPENRDAILEKYVVQNRRYQPGPCRVAAITIH